MPNLGCKTCEDVIGDYLERFHVDVLSCNKDVIDNLFELAQSCKLPLFVNASAEFPTSGLKQLHDTLLGDFVVGTAPAHVSEAVTANHPHAAVVVFERCANEGITVGKPVPEDDWRVFHGMELLF